MSSKKARHVPSGLVALHYHTMNDGKVETHHIAVSRTARYVTLGRLDERVREVWIVCHGYGQLAARFIERFRCIAAPNRLIVAPEALSRFYAERGSGFHGPSSQVGGTWMTSEDREAEIRDYVAYLDALHDEIFAALRRDWVRLCVLGFSQGATTVARWVAAGRPEPDQLVIWAGSLPAELTREGAANFTRAGRPVLIAAGSEDPFITPKILEQQVASLQGLGVESEFWRFEGGHEIDAETLRRIASRPAGS
jgi:predicted esterase